MFNKVNNILKNKYANIDLPFLLFIIGVINVKTYIKAGTILLYLIYLILKKTAFTKKIAGPLKFYLFISLIGIVAPLMNHSFNNNGYFFGFMFGLSQWLICAACFYIVFLIVQKADKEKLKGTIEIFFVANIVVVAFQLTRIMVMSRSIMPYWENGVSGRFGASTGDLLYGIFESSSITNASVCIMGGIYFLYQKKMLLSTMCILVMLLCTSNTSLVTALIALVLMLIFAKKDIKKNILILISVMIIFYPILSPANLRYMKTIYRAFVLQVPTNYQNPDSLKIVGGDNLKPAAASIDSSKKNPNTYFKSNETTYKMPLAFTADNGYINELRNLKLINDKYKKDSSILSLEQDQLKKSFLRLYGVPVEYSPLSFYAKPGKLYSFMQTLAFLRSNYRDLFFGAGMGNFSSKLAIRMTGLGIQGKYPSKYVYVSSPFIQYHLYTTLYYLCQNIGLHSVLNMPNSVYNQIAGEYGLIGLAAFVILYIGFFWQSRNKNGYGKYLLLVALIFFNMDYWFEMASLTVIFELLMLADIFIYKNENADGAFDNSINAGI